MRTFQRNFGDLQDLALRSRSVAEHNIAVAHPRALLHFFLPTKPEDLRAGSCGHSYADGVVGIENGEVARLLVFENARFRVDVHFERSMTVEVIWSNVQHDGNFWTERLNRFQLKARNLKHDHGFRLGSLGQRNRRRADVAADQRGKARGRHDLARERGGGGLAVRSRDGDDGAEQELRREFDFANHGFARRRAPAPGAARPPEPRG